MHMQCHTVVHRIAIIFYYKNIYIMYNHDVPCIKLHRLIELIIIIMMIKQG